MTKGEATKRIEELKREIIHMAENLQFDTEILEKIAECTRLAVDVVEGRYEDED